MREREWERERMREKSRIQRRMMVVRNVCVRERENFKFVVWV